MPIGEEQYEQQASSQSPALQILIEPAHEQGQQPCYCQDYNQGTYRCFGLHLGYIQPQQRQYKVDSKEKGVKRSFYQYVTLSRRTGHI